ncbi:MAG: dienelactone hydrolase family protein [Burkholderiaceae bacterium]|jgi:dienelactone hydrolase
MKQGLQFVFGILMMVLGGTAVVRAQSVGLVDTIGANLNEQIIRVPIDTSPVTELEVTMFRPPGGGPFPVLVINHGKSVGSPRQQPRARYYAVAREFVRRGYLVVLPMRRGFSGSGGQYVSAGCNMQANAQMQAADVAGVIQWLAKYSDADIRNTMVFGQSYGGLATVALTTYRELPIKLAVNFAGGLKVTSSPRPCNWQYELVDAMAEFGSRSHTPSLWFYGENDSYFGPALSAEMYNAFHGSGGQAELIRYASFKQDAHKMFGDPEGLDIWLPKTLAAMQKQGLPTQVRFVSGSSQSRPAGSGFARIDVADKLPFLRDNGRIAYSVFLKHKAPRAFALSDSGAWGWAAGDDESLQRALHNCNRYSKQACRLYAVDDEVVWRENSVAIQQAAVDPSSHMPPAINENAQRRWVGR